MEQDSSSSLLSSQRVCSRCGCKRKVEDFIGEDEEVYKTCTPCRSSRLQAKKKKVQQTAADFTDHIKENALEFSQLTDYIYDTLMELDTLNDNLEGDEPFSLEVSITLSSVFEATEENAEKSNLQVATLVAKAIGNGNGYVYVHNRHTFSLVPFCFGAVVVKNWASSPERFQMSLSNVEQRFESVVTHAGELLPSRY